MGWGYNSGMAGLQVSHDWLKGYTSQLRDNRREVSLDSHSMKRLEVAFEERREAWRLQTEAILRRFDDSQSNP